MSSTPNTALEAISAERSDLLAKKHSGQEIDERHLESLTAALRALSPKVVPGDYLALGLSVKVRIASPFSADAPVDLDVDRIERQADGTMLVVVDTKMIPAASTNNPSPITPEQSEALFWLAARDIVFFSDYEDCPPEKQRSWSSVVNCNDTFYYATADCQRLDPSDAEEVRSMYEKWGWSGVVAWSSFHRKEDPLPHLLTPEFRSAMKHLKEKHV